MNQDCETTITTITLLYWPVFRDNLGKLVAECQTIELTAASADGAGIGDTNQNSETCK